MKPSVVRVIVCCTFALSVAPITYAVGEATPKTQEQSVPTLYDTALSAFKNGNYTSAIEHLQQVLRADPKHKDAMLRMAMAYGQLGDLVKEVQSLDQLLKIDPRNSTALNNRGVALFRLKRYREMEESFKRGKAADPKDGQVLQNSGIAQLNLGNYDEAFIDFLAAKENGRPSKGLLWTKRILRQLKGDDLPLPDWTPNIASYHSKLTITRQQGFPLIDMPEFLSTQDVQRGVTSLAGYPGTQYLFGGSSDKPFEYAPGFYVWEGSVINDEKYGILLQNGTKFRYESIKGATRKIRSGQVSNWKCIISEENAKAD